MDDECRAFLDQIRVLIQGLQCVNSTSLRECRECAVLERILQRTEGSAGRLEELHQMVLDDLQRFGIAGLQRFFNAQPSPKVEL